MTTSLPNRRRPRGINCKGADLKQNRRQRLHAAGVPASGRGQRADCRRAQPKARLLMLEQRRAGLRVSEALALETRDLHLDTDRPTLRVHQARIHRSDGPWR